jgi:hypothetical protein
MILKVCKTEGNQFGEAAEVSIAGQGLQDGGDGEGTKNAADLGASVECVLWDRELVVHQG